MAGLLASRRQSSLIANTEGFLPFVGKEGGSAVWTNAGQQIARHGKAHAKSKVALTCFQAICSFWHEALRMTVTQYASPACLFLKAVSCFFLLSQPLNF